MVNVASTLVMIPRAMDGHNMEIVKGVNLCMSSIFTPYVALNIRCIMLRPL
jgi:hypothetical protein